MRKLKILGFDGWTKGLYFYKEIFNCFDKENYEFILVHYGSLGNDLLCKSSYLEDDIIINDISIYNNKLSKIIDIEKPDFVIFLSLDAYLHRAFNLLCKANKIKTIHHFHGIKTVLNFNDKSTFKINNFKRVFLLKNVVLSTLRHYIPIYVLIAFKYDFKLILHLFGDIYCRLFNVTNNIKNYDFVADLYFIYTDSDKSYLRKYYPNSKFSKIVVIGLADLKRFKINFSDKTSLKFNHKGSRNVIYFDSANFLYGIVTIKEYINHFCITQEYLNQIGYNLKIKLHPSSKSDTILDELIKNKLIVIDDEKLFSELNSTAFCLVEPSSIAPLPGVLSIPTLKVVYGVYHQIKHGELLDGYPYCLSLNHLEEIQHKLDCINLKYDDYLMEIMFKEWQSGILGEQKDYKTLISDEFSLLLNLNSFNE